MLSGTVSRYVERRRDLLSQQMRKPISQNLSMECLTDHETAMVDGGTGIATPTSPKVFLQHENGDNELLFDDNTFYDVGQQYSDTLPVVDSMSSYGALDSPCTSPRPVSEMPRSVSDYSAHVTDRPNCQPYSHSTSTTPRTRIYNSRLPKSESSTMQRQHSFRLSRNCRSESLGDQKAQQCGSTDSGSGGDLTCMDKKISASKPELKQTGISGSQSFDAAVSVSLLSPAGIKNAIFPKSQSQSRFGGKRAPPPGRLTLNLGYSSTPSSASAYSSGFSSPQHDFGFGMFGLCRYDLRENRIMGGRVVESTGGYHCSKLKTVLMLRIGQ